MNTCDIKRGEGGGQNVNVIMTLKSAKVVLEVVLLVVIIINHDNVWLSVCRGVDLVCTLLTTCEMWAPKVYLR